MRRGLVIAIDGPAGSGKSTTARKVAERLGYLYMDTGAMYRALTVKALREGLDLEDEAALGGLADRTEVVLVRGDGALRTLLDGEDVSEEIRLPEVTAKIAPVCRVPHVREVLVGKQREMGKNGGVVMEGRDIGTAVFPDAELKIYLDADVDERARRRRRELAKQGIEARFGDVRRDMLDRDRRDMEREHGPLRRAEDVVLVDTTKLTIAEQVDRIVRLAQERQQRSRGAEQQGSAPCPPAPLLPCGGAERQGGRGDFYRFCRYLVLSVFKGLFRLKVEGQRNVPQEGGVILASNHCSYLDPPLVGVATRRSLYFLAKKELFDHWGFGTLISTLNAFPVSRGFGRKAIERVLRMLREDRAVLLFPEGTRQRDGTLGRAKAGVGMIALKAGKPIVPVWISGALHAWRAFIGLRRIRVCFGGPIWPEDFRTAEDRKQRCQCIGDQVMEQIARMAGHKDSRGAEE